MIGVVVALLGALSFAGQAPATTRTIVIDAAGDDGGARAAVIGAALRARGLTLVDDDERRGFDGAVATTPGDLEAARTALLEARAAWRQLDGSAAAGHTRRAIDELFRLARLDDHLDLLGDALLFAATLRLDALDDDDTVDGGEVRRQLRLAARLAPTRVGLDPALHPPSRVEAWGAARRDNDDASDAVVVVRPRLAGARDAVTVIVDGVVVTPVGGLLHLARGPHLLTLRADDADDVNRVVDVDNDGLVIDDVLVRRRDLAARAALLARLRSGDATVVADVAAAVDTAGDATVIALDVAGRHRLAHRGVTTTVAADTDDPSAFAAAVVVACAAIDRERVVEPPAVVDDDPLPAILLSSSLAFGVVLIGGAAITIWQVYPSTPHAPPPRPVVVTCCVP